MLLKVLSDNTNTITQTIIDYLNNAELVIADMSGHNPNAFYEMGFRACTGKPMINLREKGEGIPFDISTIRAFEYDLSDLDSVDEVKRRLEQTINSFNIEENTFTELEKKINEIQDYNNAIKKLLNISGNDTSALSVKKQFISAGGKVFHYSLIIVNAYGVVEWFTEHIIKAYLEDVSMLVDTYECLPETICNNHYSFTVELLKNKGKMVKYQHLKDEDIIRNLYTCFFDQDNFVINTDAFTYHSSNLRKDAIHNMFTNVGIENIINRITKNEEFRIAVKEIEGEDDSGIEMYVESVPPPLSFIN